MEYKINLSKYHCKKKPRQKKNNLPIPILLDTGTLHWIHFLIIIFRQHSSQAITCPHGWNLTVAAFSEQTIHSLVLHEGLSVKFRGIL